ncbi:MAG: sulfurtransferase [Candidatus Goldiibacteriota bacterium]
MEKIYGFRRDKAVYTCGKGWIIIRTASKQDVIQAQHGGKTVILDIRPIDAYNGWKFSNEKRGGHIRKARSFPLKWFRYIDFIDILKSMNIKTSDDIIIYGGSSEECEKAAKILDKTGFQKVRIYTGFKDEWAADAALPMDRLERYSNLVYAAWLRSLLDTGNAPEYSGRKYVLCHCHYRNHRDYEKGHIPGALSVDTNTLESPETWNIRKPEELKKTLENLGITRDTTVIVYGRFSFPDNDDPFPGSSAGHLGAIRSALIMMYAGVKDVRILNGGMQSWEDSGYKTETKPSHPRPAADFGADIPGRPDIIINTPRAKEYIKDKDKNLVSVRSYDEFIGKVSGYNYISKKGRIPGAVFGNCGSDAYHMENYRNLDHTMKEFHETAAMLKNAGISPDKHNAFYCGTGWRASEAFFNAWLMGWPNISVYDGGWFEWSSDPLNPYETGVPEDAAAG